MRVLAGLFLALCLSAACFAAPSEPLAIEHVTVIDATGRPAQPDQTVLIVDGRISAIGPAARIKPPKGARILDARGKFLIPGLWDMHVHIAGVSAGPAWSKKVLLPLFLAHGITGVRDMGGDLEALLQWRREIDSGVLPGPRIVAAGPFLTAGGKKTPEQYPVASAEEARVAVRELKQRGADFIKIISLPSKEVFLAVADEARKQGLPFVGHVPDVVTAAEASDAGMRSIEHIMYSHLAFDCSSREDDLRRQSREAKEKGDRTAPARLLDEAAKSYDAAKAAALWATFKRNGTWVAPTLTPMSILAPRHITPEMEAANPQLAYVPESLRKEWDPLDTKNQRSAAADAWWSRQFAYDYKLASEIHRASVRILAGSDSLDRFVFVGPSLHQELGWLVEDGFTPLEALQSATRDAAEFLGKEAEFGTIAVGQRADLVLLDANPLERIGNSTAIRAVVRDGKLLDRAALDALLAQAKAAAAEAK